MMEDGNHKKFEFADCSSTIKKEIIIEEYVHSTSCRSSNLFDQNTLDEYQCEDELSGDKQSEDELDDDFTEVLQPLVEDEYQCEVESGGEKQSEDESDDDFTEVFQPLVEIKEEDAEEDKDENLNNQEISLECDVTEEDNSVSRKKDNNVEFQDLAKSHGKELGLDIQKKIFANAILQNLDSTLPFNGPFPCNICGKTFVKFGKSLKNHYLRHTEKINKSHKCLLCTFSTKDPDELKRHVASVHKNEYLFSCNICNKGFNRRKNLKMHKLNKHTSEHPFKCMDCPYSCSTRTRLRDHIRVHTGEKKLRVCKYCKETFNSYYEIEKHTAIKHKDKELLQCDRCTYSTWHSGDFVTHQAIHSDEKNFACDICGKSFVHSKRLRQHKLIHIDDASKKFRCTVCPYAAASFYYLKLHMVTHTGEKNFPCEICKKPFANRVRLKRHVTMVHEAPRPTKENKQFACGLCDKSYDDKPGLTRHIRIKHKERPSQTNNT